MLALAVTRTPDHSLNGPDCNRYQGRL